MNANCPKSCNKCGTKKVTTKRCFTLPPPKTTTTDNPIPPIPTTKNPIPPIPTTDSVVPPLPTDPTTKPPPTPADCLNKQNYGLSIPLTVDDKMLTASSSDNRWSTPRFGRLDVKSDEKSVGAWCAAYQDDKQFFQVEMRENTMIGGEEI